MSSLLTNTSGRPHGYIFASPGRGAFAPGSGRVEFTPEQIAAHNAALEQAERLAMTQSGRAVLYLADDGKGRAVIQQWAGAVVAFPHSIRKSWRNRDGRTDVSFSFAGFRWHGVNIGDNQILRCKACKS